MAVVAAVELDDSRAAGGGARDAHGGHSGLGAGTHQADFFGHRDSRADALGEFDFELGRRAVRKSAARLIGNRRNDRRDGVAENRGSVGADVVDEAIAVSIEDNVAPSPRAMKSVASADRFPCADRRIDGAGNFRRGASRAAAAEFFCSIMFISVSLCSLTSGE